MSAHTFIIDEQTTGEARTIACAEDFAREHAPRGLITFEGDLGAGKTRVVRGIVAGLGGDGGRVPSPTLAIVNEYDTPAVRVAHLDAYRLGGSDELESIGWDELVDRCGLVLVEWAERVEEALDDHAWPVRYHVRIAHAGKEERAITVTRMEP